MGDDIGSVYFDFSVVQLSAAQYVGYGCPMTLDDSLSLNPNRCHHQLITQLTLDHDKLKTFYYFLYVFSHDLQDFKIWCM